MEYILSLIFVTEQGSKLTLSINGVKSTITQAQVNSLMDLIIAKNIFLPASGGLVSKGDAKLTERKITKYEVA